LKTREKIELGLIPLVAVAIGSAGNHLPSRLSPGALLAIGCLGWLVQGGLRDLWLLHLTKTDVASAPRRKVACMCLESSAGLIGIILGGFASLLGWGGDLLLTPVCWGVFAFCVLAFGFLAKDYVVSWRPLGLRREPEHHTFIFTWR
jgi:hypothetical protein